MFFVVFLLKKSTLYKNSILYQGGRYRTYTELGLGSLPWLEPLSYKKNMHSSKIQGIKATWPTCTTVAY